MREDARIIRLDSPKQQVPRSCRGAVVVVLSLATLLAAATGIAIAQLSPIDRRAQSEFPAAPPGYESIRHVVIIFQENRTPDNLFHDPALIANGADIASSGLNSKGKVIQLTAGPLANNYSDSHTHQAFLTMYDGGKMDGADKVKVSCSSRTNCPPRHPQFKYVRAEDVAPYFELAEQYTFADRMFQTNQGPSFPAHQFIISGTSAPTADSDLFAAENPSGIGDPNANSGCTAPKREFVRLIDPEGDEGSKQYPCFEHPTLPDLLDNAGVSWRYYAKDANQMWTAPNAIYHLRFGADWDSDMVFDPPQVLSDIAAGQLASVSWVIPKGGSSDHPGQSKDTGPSWVASIVNAVGSSSYWSDTVILIAWDDWGGWYDHVAPPIKNAYEYGFRVPLIVVSPFARPAYISHVTHDFGSLLKFTEEVFGLPSLGYADQDADDLSDCFDFNQQARKFQKIAAPLDADYFRNDPDPATDPDDD